MAEEKADGVVETRQNKRKMYRAKKKMCKKIQNQMEFYFSDSNLAKDRFLGKLVAESEGGYVDLEVFKTFNKIREITDSVEVIAEATSNSGLLELSSDGKKVHRVNPSSEKKNFDDCTIYVERLPPQADYRWLKDVFQQFGSVAYVSIPRFKNTGKIKGFAFLEFNSEESAAKACENYKSSNEDESEDENKESKGKKHQGHKKKQLESPVPKNKDLSQRKHARKRQKSESDLTPEKLSKISADEFSGEQHSGQKDDLSKASDGSLHKYGKSPHKSNKKRKRQMSEGEGTPKKAKPTVSPASSNSEIKITPLAKTTESNIVCKNLTEMFTDTEPKSKEVTGTEKLVSSTEELLTETKEIKSVDIPKRSRNDDESDGGTTTNKNVSIDTCEKMDLTVHEDSQENNEKELQSIENEKDVLVKKEEVCDSIDMTKKKRRQRKKKKTKAEDDKLNLRVMSKADWKSYRNKYLSLQRATMSHIKKVLMLHTQQMSHTGDMLNEVETGEERNEALVEEAKPTPPTGSKIEFQPGVIIKIVLPEAVASHAEQKKQIRSIVDVPYVDSFEGSTQIHVRCHSSESALSITTDGKFNHLGSVEILKGEEESNYWEKLKNDREKKFNSNSRQKKRGRDKILAKAAKMLEQKNSHVRFDD